MLDLLAVLVPQLADYLSIIGFFRFGGGRLRGYSTEKRRSCRVRRHADGIEVIEKRTTKRRFDHY